MIDTLHYSVIDQVLDTGLDQSQFDICQRADPHDVVASIDVGDDLERNVAVKWLALFGFHGWHKGFQYLKILPAVL